MSSPASSQLRVRYTLTLSPYFEKLSSVLLSYILSPFTVQYSKVQPSATSQSSGTVIVLKYSPAKMCSSSSDISQELLYMTALSVASA